MYPNMYLFAFTIDYLKNIHQMLKNVLIGWLIYRVEQTLTYLLWYIFVEFFGNKTRIMHLLSKRSNVMKKRKLSKAPCEGGPSKMLGARTILSFLQIMEIMLNLFVDNSKSKIQLKEVESKAKPMFLKLKATISSRIFLIYNNCNILQGYYHIYCIPTLLKVSIYFYGCLNAAIWFAWTFEFTQININIQLLIRVFQNALYSFICKCKPGTFVEF